MSGDAWPTRTRVRVCLEVDLTADVIDHASSAPSSESGDGRVRVIAAIAKALRSLEDADGMRTREVCIVVGVAPPPRAWTEDDAPPVVEVRS